MITRTWKSGGGVDLSHVRSCRKTLHSWGVTSKLSVGEDVYTLTVKSDDQFAVMLVDAALDIDRTSQQMNNLGSVLSMARGKASQ